MKQKITLVLIIIGAAMAVIACSGLFKGYVDDNIAEELVEAVIEAKTGITIDLTLNSPEK